MSTSVRVRSWRRALEVHARVLARRLRVKECIPGEHEASPGSLSLVWD